jgi:hypothetical protein
MGGKGAIVHIWKEKSKKIILTFVSNVSNVSNVSYFSDTDLRVLRFEGV